MKRLTYDSRNVSWDGGSYFIKGRVVGKFLYFEDYITPETAAFLGGMIATAATRQLKPILFIHHLQKFRVIKNLKHFKTFIDTKYPQYSELVVSKSEMQSNTGQAKVKDVVQLILSQIE